jgi:hypothetical protein
LTFFDRGLPRDKRAMRADGTRAQQP